MRRSLLTVALLAGAIGATAEAPASTAAATPAVAAASVVASPPLSPIATTAAISADGAVVAGRTDIDPNKPYTVYDLTQNTQVNETPFQLLTGDGRHVVSSAEVRTVGGTGVALPPLPDGMTADGVVGASADGGVVLTTGYNNSTLYNSVYASAPGGSTAVDVNGSASGVNLNRGARGAAVSANGRYVSYVHVDFVAGCPFQSAICVFQVYRRDLSDGSATLVSTTAEGTESNGLEQLTRISDDGRFVAFVSDATDLAPGATTAKQRLYRRDIITGRTVLVADDLEFNNAFVLYTMSGDGMRFAYAGKSAVNGAPDVRIADLAAGTNLPLVRFDTTAQPACSTNPVLSGNGRHVLFRSCSTADIQEPAGAPNAAAMQNRLGLATLAPIGETTGYTGVTPSRLYDSRNGEIDTRANLAAGTQVTVTVGGHGGVPADATAAVLNVTVTNAAGPGFVTVWPCDQDRPTASNLNYSAGQTIPNAVIAGLAADGTVCLYTHNAADLIVDVSGSFGATSSYGSAAPLRVLDTRGDENPLTPPTLATGSVTRLAVATLADLPDSATAVTLNVTVTKTAGAGFVTVYPCDTDLPTASNLNYAAGQTVPNAVISQLASDGTVCLYTHNAADLIVDVNGFFTADSGFVGLAPSRLLDSRDGQDDAVPNLAGGSVTTLTVTGPGRLPSGATTAVLNVTVTNPTAAGFVTVYPCDSDLPTASNLNYVAGQTIPNLVVSKLSAAGTVCLYTKAPADLIVDVAGYLGPTPLQ